MMGERVPKPTLLDLWRRHPEIRCSALFELPEVVPIVVLETMVWGEGTRNDIECILQTVNRLAGTEYTLRDIEGIKIVSASPQGM